MECAVLAKLENVLAFAVRSATLDPAALKAPLADAVADLNGGVLPGPAILRAIRSIAAHVCLKAPAGSDLWDVENLMIGLAEATYQAPNRSGRLPNLLIAGFPRSGSTSVYHMLIQSPDVACGHIKETGHFFQMHRFSARLYAAFYPQTDDRFLIDGTPAYAQLRSSQMKLIAETLPSADIILAMRDPVARAVSSYSSRGRSVARDKAKRGVGQELPTIEQSLQREVEMLRGLLPAYYGGDLTYDDLLAQLPTQHVFGGLYDIHAARMKAAMPDARFHAIDLDKGLAVGVSAFAAEVGISMRWHEDERMNAKTAADMPSARLQAELRRFYEAQPSVS